MPRPWPALRAEVGAFTRAGGRAVCVGQDLLGVDTILPGERRPGPPALAQALVALGHRRVRRAGRPATACSPPRTGWPGSQAGLRRLVGRRWTRGDVIHGAFTRDGGYEAMSTVLAAGGTRCRTACSR